MEHAGASSARAANVAAHATRTPKDHEVDRAVLVASWRLRAGQLGLDREALQALVPGGRTAELAPTHELAARLLGPAGLTKHKATFSAQEVLRALAEAAPDGATVAVLERQTGYVVTDSKAVALGGDRFEQRWSTEDMLRTERQLIASAFSARSAGRAGVDEAGVSRVLRDRPGLSGEQADAVARHVSAFKYSSSSEGVPFKLSSTPTFK
jgi:hypothetical protein